MGDATTSRPDALPPQPAAVSSVAIGSETGYRLRILGGAVTALALTGLVVAAVTLTVLYRAALDQQRHQLSEMVQAQARLINAVARFDREHSAGDHPQGAAAATIGQVIDAHGSGAGIGETGEVLLGQAVDRSIVFLLQRRHPYPAQAERIALEGSPLAEPMRRALRGESGVMSGPDYRNEPVVAAYVPVSELGLGVVAKVDLDEVRAPFVRAGTVALAIGLCLVVGGGLLLVVLTNPVLRRLEGSEQQFRSFVSNMPGITYRAEWGEGSRLLFIGGATAEICGYGADHFRVNGVDAWASLLHPDDAERVFTAFTRANESGRPTSIEYRVRHRDGSVRWVADSIQPVFDDDGRFRYHDGVVLDITDRREAEDSLRQSQQLIDGLLENTNAVIYVKDRAGRYVLVNRQWTDVVGLSAEESLGQTDFQLMPPGVAEQFVETDQEAISLKRSVTREESPDSSTDGRIFISNKFPLLDDDGEVTHLAGVSYDVTALKRAEAQAEAANRAKSEFLSNMSHELRTPLNGVLGYAQIMLRDAALTAEQRESMNAIRNCGQHLLTLINDVLDLSKIESGRLEIEDETVDLQRLLTSVRDVLAQRASDKGVAFQLDVAPEIPRGVRTDATKLRQVLVNLAGNAVKFTQRGAVTIRVTEPNVGRLRFEVEDTGVGMSADELADVFDAFKQAAAGKAAGGTGLGLAISRRVVEAMGGTMSASSETGKGSVFAFELPLAEVELDETTERQDALDDATTLVVSEGLSLSILVADDRPENRDILDRLLTPIGIRVLHAGDGAAALDVLSEHAVDAVLMDVRMPVMNGLEATRRIRRDPLLRDVKIIAVSASVFENQRERIRIAGCDDFLGKPLRATELYQKLAEHLGLTLVSNAADTRRATNTDLTESPLSPERGSGFGRRLNDLAAVGDVASIEELTNSELNDGPAEQALRDRILSLVRDFDLDGLRALAECLDAKETP